MYRLFSALLPFSSIVGSLILQSCAMRLPVPEKSATSVQHVSVKRNIPVGPTVTVYVVADSLHTALVFPYDWIVNHGYRAPKDFKFSPGPYRYVEMSWGNQVAYLQKRWLYPWEVFNALCLPSPSVTEVIPVSWKIEDVCFQQRIYRGEIQEKNGQELASFLNSCNKFDQNDNPQVIAPSSWGDGCLIDCKHSYYFPRICNVWTAQSLESCGLKINVGSALTANGLLKQVEKQGFIKVHDGVRQKGRKNVKPE
jgi:hypothetical protein